MPRMSSNDRHTVQGILVRFFPNGDAHHPGVTLAINTLEIKSWEAFLNYLNRQPRLILASGGIRHVYSPHGEEIRAMSKFRNRHSYIVSSGTFTKTNYRHITDAYYDPYDLQDNQENRLSNGLVRPSVIIQWRAPSINGEQLFILPYSRLNLYEIMILNRNLTVSFDQWLNEEVTDLLSHYISNGIITHLYAITKLAFIEVKKANHLFPLNYENIF